MKLQKNGWTKWQIVNGRGEIICQGCKAHQVVECNAVIVVNSGLYEVLDPKTHRVRLRLKPIE